VGPNGPFFGCVNALINPPPVLAWRSFLANLQENGFKKTPLGWIVFVVGWRWGSPEGTSGPFCAHELLHTNFVHKRCTNRFVLCTNRFLGPFRIFWRSHPRRGLVHLESKTHSSFPYLTKVPAVAFAFFFFIFTSTIFKSRSNQLSNPS